MQITRNIRCQHMTVSLILQPITNLSPFHRVFSYSVIEPKLLRILDTGEHVLQTLHENAGKVSGLIARNCAVCLFK